MFGCTEILFNPKLLGSKNEGVHINLKNTLENLDNDLVFDYSNNITFAGGTTMIKGFLERIKKEFEKLWGNKKFSMKYNEKNINSAWLGGSLVSNLSSFQTEFIDKKEYEEYGSIIIQRKCFY